MGHPKLQCSKKHLYENGMMLGPDGRPLCRLDYKRLNWYITRGIADKVSDNPLTIKLKFAPKGDGHSGEAFMIIDRENRCVVCGCSENLTRHHVVPHCYRRHMHRLVKRLVGYDLLPLCVHHHASYEEKVRSFTKELCTIYGVEMPSSKTTKEENDSIYAKGRAYTLIKHAHKIPADKILKIKESIAKFLGKKIEELTDEDIAKMAASIPVKAERTHLAKSIVDKIPDIEGLHVFYRRWREHFVKTMNPQYLPEIWTIDRKVL